MGVGSAKPTTAHAQSRAVKVNVLPPESQCFALAQPERQRDSPTGAVPPFARHRQEAPNLLDRVGLNLVVIEFRSLSELRGVPTEVPPPHRLVERRPDGAVRLVGGGGLAAAGLHLGVE